MKSRIRSPPWGYARRIKQCSKKSNKKGKELCPDHLRLSWKHGSFFVAGSGSRSFVTQPAGEAMRRGSGCVFMAFINSAINMLKVLVIAIGCGLAVWGVINLLEGYGNDNPGANAHVR